MVLLKVEFERANSNSRNHQIGNDNCMITNISAACIYLKKTAADVSPSIPVEGLLATLNI